MVRPVIQTKVPSAAAFSLGAGPLLSGRGQASGRQSYAASVALFVDASWKTSSQAPVLTSNSLPKPTHLPVIRRPVGSTSSWIAPWYRAPR